MGHTPRCNLPLAKLRREAAYSHPVPLGFIAQPEANSVKGDNWHKAGLRRVGWIIEGVG